MTIRVARREARELSGMEGRGPRRRVYVFEPHKKLLSPDMAGAQKHPSHFPGTHTGLALFLSLSVFCFGSLPLFSPLSSLCGRGQKGQWNSHQKPQAHGKEIRALGILLPGGSEASPPAWLLSGMRVWWGCVLTLASSYVKHQTAGGQPGRSWPSGPHLGSMCAHTGTEGEGTVQKSLPVSSVRATAKL